MNPISSFQDRRHSVSFLLSRPISPSIQGVEPARPTSSLSQASTVTENALSRSTSIEPPSGRASENKDASASASPILESSASPPPTDRPTSGEQSPDVRSRSRSTTPLDPARVKGKAPAVFTPLLTQRRVGYFSCRPCMPTSIWRSEEPWWVLQPNNPGDEAYVNYKSAVLEYGPLILERIEFVPTRPNNRVPGVSILRILHGDDVIVDGDKAVDVDSLQHKMMELRYEDRREKVQLRCYHCSVTIHGLAYLMSTHVYHYLEEKQNTQSDLYSIGDVLNASLVSIYSLEPGIWIPEIAFGL